MEQLGHGCVWNQDVMQLVHRAWKTSTSTSTSGSAETHHEHVIPINSNRGRVAMELTRVDDALFGLITALEATKLEERVE